METLLERFEAKFTKGGEDECWIWSGGKTTAGYGAVQYAGRLVYAHRLSYQFYVGEIPEGMCVCHKCDCPSCVNPSHLFIGTQKDNMHDCAAKNRTTAGEKHGGSKLTDTDVIAIRASTEKQKALAIKYGVVQQEISFIKTNKRWKHIKEGVQNV